MIRKIITFIINFISRSSVYLACLGLSLFIYLNVVEKVALVDLPYINSVNKTDFPKVLHQVSEEQKLTQNQDQLGFFGKPVVLRIPKHNYSISIGEEKIEENQWVVSNQVASMHIFDESQGGNIGSFVIFSAPKSGQLAIADLLVEGDRLVVDTEKGWRYNFRVNKRIIVPQYQKYLVNNLQTTKLILLRDANSNATILVEASFLSVEERGIS